MAVCLRVPVLVGTSVESFGSEKSTRNIDAVSSAPRVAASRSDFGQLSRKARAMRMAAKSVACVTFLRVPARGRCSCYAQRLSDLSFRNEILESYIGNALRHVLSRQRLVTTGFVALAIRCRWSGVESHEPKLPWPRFYMQGLHVPTSTMHRKRRVHLRSAHGGVASSAVIEEHTGMVREAVTSKSNASKPISHHPDAIYASG